MRQSILIVDDIELNRAILSEVFRDEYDILEAENGREALDILESRSEDIAALLLDIVMPVMDGYQLLERLQGTAIMERIPVFLITAENDTRVTMRGYGLGVVDIINKPFAPAFIRRRIGNIIELYENRRQLRGIVKEQVAALEQQARQLEQQAKQLQETNSSIIETLATVIEFRDCESGEHVRRIRSLTFELLQRLNLPDLDEEQIQLISEAAVMHDVGKISIPDYILNKPGRLTASERVIMQEHTIRGCEILESVPRIRESDMYPYCWDICRHHHERWDGNGYPDRLQGNGITVWSQVVSLADVYDALVSRRVYKEAYPHEEAVRMILNEEGGAFNPELVRAFSEIADMLHEKLYSWDEPEKLYYERKDLIRQGESL